MRTLYAKRLLHTKLAPYPSGRIGPLHHGPVRHQQSRAMFVAAASSSLSPLSQDTITSLPSTNKVCITRQPVSSNVAVVPGGTVGGELSVRCELSGSRFFSTTTKNCQFYYVEVSNAARQDATQLTITGPDVPGLLASMTVALAVKGCSLLALHADTVVKEEAVHIKKETGIIQDVFLVVNRNTGKPFADDDLHDLGKALLEATKSPMNVLSVKGAMDELEKLDENMQHAPQPEDNELITVVPSTAGTKS